MEGEFTLNCPIPISHHDEIQVAHGGGGRMMHDLISDYFAAGFEGLGLQSDQDAAVVDLPASKIAFTTDSYVVSPLIFPGGTIGDLAINGTVNDLAMRGARPLYVSVGFILEEGLKLETLWNIILSIRSAAHAAGIAIVTGDTKVVERGKGDGVFINTSGVGVIEHGFEIGTAAVKEGDSVIVNGDLGRHGMAIMAQREGLQFESTIESDTCPLNGLVSSLLEAGVRVHCMRDLTRGGLASALNEVAGTNGLRIHVDERTIPVLSQVRGACEILGLDPLYVANEGRAVFFVSHEDSSAALELLQSHPAGKDSVQIGSVTGIADRRVTLRSAIGIERILDMLSGEQLPRIC